MHDEVTARRRFIVAAVTVSVYALATPGSRWLKGISAWAGSSAEPGEFPRHLARLLFPHDGVADSVYAEVMDGVLAAAADPALIAALQSAETALDSRGGKPWLSLAEAEQIAVLMELQDQAFFNAILTAVRGHFYYNKAVWKYLDYPGPSKQLGGYLHRGFDDIDWLPERA